MTGSQHSSAPFFTRLWARFFAQSTRSTRAYATGTCVFSALMLLSAWATLAALLGWQWQQTLDTQMRQNTNTALALEEHTLHIISTVDQAITRLQDATRAGRLTGEDLVHITHETGMAPHILKQLTVIDAEGRFMRSSLDPEGSRNGKASLGDYDYVRAHLQSMPWPDEGTGQLHQGLFISGPLPGNGPGEKTIALSRKIEAADGRTLGVVVATLRQNHFADVYRSVQLGTEGGVVLVGLDGVIRARVMGGHSADHNKLLPDSLVKTLLQQPNGTIVSPSADGLQRIMGYSRVGKYPLTVISGTSEQQSFAAWRTTRNRMLVLTAVLSLCVVAFVAMFLQRSQRLANEHIALVRSEAQAQSANQAKSDFLATMSHELRTPLTNIRGFAELMELRSQDPQIRKQSGYIREGAEHLNTLLTEILDLAKIEAGVMPTHPEPVELRGLVHDVAELFRIGAMAKSLALTVIIAPTVPIFVVTDRLRLKQILSNLLSNAIKFTAEGSVKLVIEPHADGRYLHFHVVDTGPGIPSALHGVIFEKFSQGSASVSKQYGGTGLGLSLSRALAELLGGTLLVKSRLGEGAKFTLTLPSSP